MLAGEGSEPPADLRRHEATVLASRPVYPPPACWLIRGLDMRVQTKETDSEKAAHPDVFRHCAAQAVGFMMAGRVDITDPARSTPCQHWKPLSGEPVEVLCVLSLSCNEKVILIFIS